MACDGCKPAEAILGGGLIAAGVEIGAAAPTVVGEAVAVPAAVVTVAGAAVTAGAVLLWHSVFGSSDVPAPTHVTNAYAPNVPLSRDQHGNAKVDEEAHGVAHTQLGTKTSTRGAKGTYTQGRTFDKNGKTVKDIHHTDHGEPDKHPNPHQHVPVENPTGGTPQHGPAEPLTNH